ncbi:MAG: hypothetical protein H0Z32_13305 [Bacillaceae bacterium]|nr:hypothetical protein [Bacillaceae bacterium]
MLNKTDPFLAPGGDHPSIVILSRWLTPHIIFTPIAISITLGVMSAFFYSLAILTALTAVVVVFRKRFSLHEYTLDEWMGNVLSKGALKWTHASFKAISYSQLYLLTLGGGTVLQALFSFPLPISMFIFLGLGMFMVWLKPGMPHRHHVKVGMFLLALTGLLVYIFMTESLEDIYHGLRLYHPYLLFMSWKNIGLFFLAVSLIVMGKTMMDPVTWQYLQKVNRQKSFRQTYLTNVVWASIGIAISSITFAMIYSGSFEGLITIVVNMFHFLGNQFMILTVAMIILYILLDTFEIETRLLNGYREKKGSHIPFVLLVMTTITYESPDWYTSFVDLFFLFGIAYAGFLPVYSKLLWAKRTYGIYMPIAAIISGVLGYVSLVWVNFQQAVLIAFGISLVLTVLEYVWHSTRSGTELNKGGS